MVIDRNIWLFHTNCIIQLTTINGEAFTGINVHSFHSFQEYHESFSMNISINKHFWLRKHKTIFTKTSVGLKPQKLSPANFSPSTVILSLTLISKFVVACRYVTIVRQLVMIGFTVFCALHNFYLASLIACHVFYHTGVTLYTQLCK